MSRPPRALPLTLSRPKQRELVVDGLARGAQAALDDDTAAQVYRTVITHPDADRTELARLAQLSVGQVDQALGWLAEQGSVLLRPDGSWHVPPPDITLPARAGQLEREALRIRSVADELAVVYHRARAERGKDHAIEMLDDSEEVQRCFLQVLSGARQQVRSLDRPPYRDDGHEVSDVQRQQAAEGVRFLTVYDIEVVQNAHRMAALDELNRIGEQMRVLKGVPLKLVVADDDTALISVRTPGGGCRGSMLVRRSPLLDSLVLLFETLWRLAVPLPPAPRQGAERRLDEGPGPRDQRVLMLLAGGATDETIARQLGLSTRTVERRVRALLDRLGAETRFQAGVQAARREWL